MFFSLDLNRECKMNMSFMNLLYAYRTETMLERIYKPQYDYQNFSPLANGTDLNRQKYAILQTHWN